MTDEVVIKRYADAFLSYAKDTIGFDKGIDELQGVKRIIRDNPDFGHFLESLDIADDEKDPVIDRILGEEFSAQTKSFLKLLLKKNRIGMFTDIAEYARINYAHGAEVDGVLKVSYPLDTDVMERIKGALEKRLNKKLHLYVELDSTMLGGVRAHVGNIIIDGSVRKRLEDMKDKLLALKVV